MKKLVIMYMIILIIIILLKTKKLTSYLLWKEIHKHITNKDHLDSEFRIKLIEMATKVNSSRRKSK